MAGVTFRQDRLDDRSGRGSGVVEQELAAFEVGPAKGEDCVLGARAQRENARLDGRQAGEAIRAVRVNMPEPSFASDPGPESTPL